MKKIVVGMTLPWILLAYALLVADGAKQVRDHVRPLVLADGTMPAPLCWPGLPCGSAHVSAAVPMEGAKQNRLLLADGTWPMPTCWPGQPCAAVAMSIPISAVTLNTRGDDLLRLADGGAPAPLCWPDKPCVAGTMITTHEAKQDALVLADGGGP